jgi:hypothetical protein
MAQTMYTHMNKWKKKKKEVTHRLPRNTLFVVESTTKIEEGLTAHFLLEWLKTTVALPDAWKEQRYFSRSEDMLKITSSSVKLPILLDNNWRLAFSKI